MGNRLRRMLVKEFLEMLRDKRMRAIVFLMPLVQMTVLAFAMTTDVDRIPTAVVDPDGTPATRALVQRFASGGAFDIRTVLHSDEDVQDLLDSEAVRVVIRFPLHFTGDLRAGRPVNLQLLADGTQTSDTAMAFLYAGRVVDRFNRERAPERAESAAGTSAPVALDVRAVYNPNLVSHLYYVPGLIAIMLMLVSTLLTSLAIVREKEIGTIEQVMVTPIRRVEFILGKTLPFLITGYITMTLMFLIALAVFGIRIEGSTLLLYLLAGLYVANNLGVALLISVSARTQQQALLTAFFYMLPAVLLSGLIFPIRNMPECVQWLTVVNPMRWFLEILHGIVLRGVGLEILWPAACAQTFLAAGFLSLAVARFRKTLE